MAFTPSSPKKILFVFIVAVFVLFIFGVISVKADNALDVLPFSQNWSDVSLITANDDWSNVPSIIGYLGNDDTKADIDVDPQTLLLDSAAAIDVIANQINTGITNGGVAEFSGIADPTIALQASGTADAPYIKIFLDARNANLIHISYDVRDIDVNDNAVQQVALHYRVGSSGNFTNIPAGYIADATDPLTATKVTPIDVVLSAAANGQPLVELRIMTTNATGFDEWIGIDNITITANYAPTGIALAPNSIFENQPAGTTIGMLTAADPNVTDTHIFTLVNSTSCLHSGADNLRFSVTGNLLETSASFDYETKSSYFVCAQAADNYGLFKIEELQVDIFDVADETPPAVLTSNPVSGAILLVSPSQITIQFNEDVKHDSGTGAANIPANYLLVEAGADKSFETKSCADGAALTDTKIMVNAASYQNSGGIYTSALTVNSGAALPVGKYRLFICGTTSIEDLSGNKLGNGDRDAQIGFAIHRTPANLPTTGFPIGDVTQLPEQPANKTYADFSSLWLEIPSLKISAPIVGVPFTETGWDVTWLGANAGWLNETAFPTWAGNSVITAHVWDSYNQPGLFYKLRDLQYGDFIKIHAFGQIFVYEVRESARIAPNHLSAALKHEDNAWLTLLTCEDYKTLFQTYSYRRMVRAVWVSVVPEK